MGPPILVIISSPLSVMALHMSPSVSTWAHRPIRLVCSRPGTSMTRPPLLVRRVA